MGTPGRKPKYKAPNTNVYGSVIQSTDKQETQDEYYRFNAKMPMECKDYLQEMAWRNRTTITAYLTQIILADMKAHPEWRDTLDILNK